MGDETVEQPVEVRRKLAPSLGVELNADGPWVLRALQGFDDSVLQGVGRREKPRRLLGLPHAKRVAAVHAHEPPGADYRRKLAAGGYVDAVVGRLAITRGRPRVRLP